MLAETTEMTSCFEQALAASIVELTSEFRSYDIADLIALIRLDKMPSLRALLEDDCETFFKTDTMAFANYAEVMIRWHELATVRLAMVFRNLDVELHFRLTLEASEAAVDIDLLRFDPPVMGDESKLRHLQAALSDARKPAATHR